MLAEIICINLDAMIQIQQITQQYGKNRKGKKMQSLDLGHHRIDFLKKFPRELYKEFRKRKVLYLMMLPGILCFLVFNYLPLSGIVVAFKSFNFKEGIFGSPWAGFENFKFFINSSSAWRAAKNTLLLNSSFILVHTTLQISLALLISEIKNVRYKKISQSITFLPFLISWIVISVFSYNLFNYEFGSINTFLKSIGYEPMNITNNPSIWPYLLIIIDSWKWVGFGIIIYLAALTGINQEYYEAATIDGAGKWMQIFYISIPLIMPTVTIITLLDIGRILSTDFGMFYGIIGDNSALFSTTDVIDTYVYRSLRKLGDIGMASAVGFLQSVVGFILVMISNLVVRRYQEDGALF